MTITDLLKQMVAKRASDVHLQVGSPPTGRIDGRLVRFGDKNLAPSDAEALARVLLTPEQWEEFEYKNELDFAYTLPGVARFRCNVFRQRSSVGIVMRIIGEVIPSFEALGLPPQNMVEFAAYERGLFLVTGQTGSGKSMTLASLVDHINRTYTYNVITVEDPIEMLHKNKQSIVVQREVGADTKDFRTALKYSMRQDPDVIMIGEMRDRETVEAALSAAQTGHLVLSTLHTNDSVRTVNRIIDFFPPHERDQIRIMLADSLIGILSQRLLPRADNTGRVLAYELLINTPLIKDYVKDEDKTPLIKEALIEDNVRGMHTFDQHLVVLYTSGMITLEEALSSATSPHELRLMVTRMGTAGVM